MSKIYLNGEKPEYDLFLHTMLYESGIADVFKFFRENQIEPILIKGISISRFYDKSHYRPTGDIDLCFKKEDYTKATKILAQSNELTIAIDLHNEFRKLDLVDFTYLFENTHVITLSNGYKIRVLSPEDHLRILAVHWLNDGGINKEKLWDIYYAVSNRPETFDWEKCLNVVSPIRRKWVLTAIGLAHYYLELPIDDLPFADEIKQPNFIPKWIFETVEYEWKSDIHLRPLISSFKSPKIFIQQIRKRFPPNPIQSAIETNTSFDDRFRLPSQIKAILKRMLPQDGNTASLASTIYRKLTIRK